MASSMVHRAMVYLGLVDDDEYDYDSEYDEYGAYPDPNAPARGRVQPQGGVIQPPEQFGGSGGAVRTLGADETSQRIGSVGSVTPRPSAVVRPLVTEKTSKVNVVLPERFKDAQDIADSVKSHQPVIVNLQNVDRDLSRRMIDFCSGVTYSLGGSMDKVAEQVFLITPPNVEITAEERQRLEDGQYRG